MGIFGSAMALVGMVAGMTMQAANPVALEPAGKWMVNYEENMCVLSREFGEGDSKVLLGLKPSGIRSGGYLIVMAPNKEHGSILEGKIPLQLSPGTSPVQVGYQSSAIGAGNKLRLTQFSLEEDDFASIGSLSIWTLPVTNKRTVTIAPHNLSNAIKALDTCQEKLLERWGVDSAALAAVATPASAATPKVNWLMPDDYPKEALRNRQQGTVIVLWAIETDGRAGECRTVSSSGTPSLDTAACNALLRRARYKPALGKDGRPIRSWEGKKVVWRLPYG